jgi:heat shock protein HslJ
MRTTLTTLAVVAALSLGGCAEAPSETPPKAPPPADAGETPRRVVYLCERAQSMTVTFTGATASLLADGLTARLAAQPAGSGMRYLGDGHELRGKGADITWVNPTGIVRQCRDQAAAMRQPQIQPPRMTLAGTSWTLIHFQSSDDSIGKIVPPRPERYTLRFAADGGLALQLDCNRARGRWEATPSSASGGALKLTGGAMTRAMCGPGAMDSRIARDLAFVRSYTFAGGRLSLALEADAGFYVWAPAGGRP